MQSAVRIPNARGSELDGFDDAFGTASFDHVAHQIGVLEQYEEPGYNVVDERLRTKANDETKKACAREKRQRVEPEHSQDQHRGRKVGGIHERAAKQRHHGRPPATLHLVDALAGKETVLDLEMTELDGDATEEEDADSFDQSRSPECERYQRLELRQRQRRGGNPDDVLEARAERRNERTESTVGKRRNAEELFNCQSFVVPGGNGVAEPGDGLRSCRLVSVVMKVPMLPRVPGRWCRSARRAQGRCP